MGKIVVGILAHVDAGKTTLSEGMLYTSGAIRTMGRVDNRDAFLDTYALERERGITIFSKQAVFPLGTTQVTLLDTPGHVDFSPEMERTLQVLDYAILVISGADGVQGHTRTLWNLLRRYEIPTFVFVNKMDQKGTDAEVLLQELKNVLEEGCVDFSAKRDAHFYEETAVCSEDALEEFLETGRLKKETLQELFLERQLFPCFFGSALRLEGVKEFVEQMQELIKVPAYPETFGAKVFKIARDEAGNRLTYLKITGGSLKVKAVIEGQKVNQIRIYSGEKYEAVNEVEAGSICAVTGLSDTYPGEGLGAEQGDIGIHLPVIHIIYLRNARTGQDIMELVQQQITHRFVIIPAQRTAREHAGIFCIQHLGFGDTVLPLHLMILCKRAAMEFKIQFIIYNRQRVGIFLEFMEECADTCRLCFGQYRAVRHAFRLFTHSACGASAPIAEAVGEQTHIRSILVTYTGSRVIHLARIHMSSGYGNMAKHLAAVNSLPNEGIMLRRVYFIAIQLVCCEIPAAASQHDLGNRGIVAEGIGQPKCITGLPEVLLHEALSIQELADHRFARCDVAVTLHIDAAVDFVASLHDTHAKFLEYRRVIILQPLRMQCGGLHERKGRILSHKRQHTRKGAGAFPYRLLYRPKPCGIQM